MFCLDYFLSFFAHSGINYFLVNGKGEKKISNLAPFHSVSTGALAGTFSALALYPFDFVRMSTVPKNVNHFAFSSIPFTALYLGVFFSLRDHTSLKSQIFCACGSMTLGTLAEIPFDSAKKSMVAAGNVRLLLLTAGLRIPLGSFLLVVYVKIFTRKILKIK